MFPLLALNSAVSSSIFIPVTFKDSHKDSVLIQGEPEMKKQLSLVFVFSCPRLADVGDAGGSGGIRRWVPFKQSS